MENDIVQPNVASECIVTPWEVKCSDNGIDYDKLIVQFGCQPLSDALLQRFEKVTGCKPHQLLRRGLFFAHRDFDEFLTAFEKGQEVYLYTGRGPSSEALHLGHLIPFLFTKWLQDAFKCIVVIQMTDDEKFLFKPDLTLEETRRLAYENAKDILSIGFDVRRTFLFSDVDHIQHLYPVALKIQKKITYSQARGIFGFTESDNIGRVAFPAIQAAPSFAITFPSLLSSPTARCLIPAAIDQDPYFRMTRDIAPRMNLPKPSCIYSKFIAALQGAKTKMSGSESESSILITDSPKDVQRKIAKYAFSGGGDTLEAHREKGANLEVDVPYQYLSFLLDDDSKLKWIADEYGSGRMLTSEIKKILVETVNELLKSIATRRAQVTDADLHNLMNPNKEAF